MYIIINILSLLSTLLLTSRFQVLPMLQKRALYKGVNNRGKNCGNQFSVCQQWQHVCSPSWGMVTWRVRESGICSGGSYSHGSSELQRLLARGSLQDPVLAGLGDSLLRLVFISRASDPMSSVS